MRKSGCCRRSKTRSRWRVLCSPAGRWSRCEGWCCRKIRARRNGSSARCPGAARGCRPRTWWHAACGLRRGRGRNRRHRPSSRRGRKDGRTSRSDGRTSHSRSRRTRDRSTRGRSSCSTRDHTSRHSSRTSCPRKDRTSFRNTGSSSGSRRPGHPRARGNNGNGYNGCTRQRPTGRRG